MSKFLDTALSIALWPLFRGIVSMPGKSYAGELPPLTAAELALKLRLEGHLNKLAVEIGERSLERPQALEAASRYIFECLALGGQVPEIQTFPIVEHNATGKNIIWEKRGSKNPEKIFVVGAHYDTVPGTPGADDNATGVAALIELARYFADTSLPATVRFVAFDREETRNYPEMGSYAHAQRCSERGEQIAGMMSLEMLGAYSNKPGSQRYPYPFSLFYPKTGNFIGFVGNKRARSFIAKSVELFRKHNRFPCEGCAAPDWMRDAERSDHKGFRILGYDSYMVTDTSNFRYGHYHTHKDTVENLEFESFTRVVAGLGKLIEALARS